jgi:CRISPR-associated protein Cmr1
MTAVQLSYTVRFLSPAFLGNAEQNGQWRTPPFKALLRQWWRVAYAADHRFSMEVNEMRVAEGQLFGAAADAGDSNKSRVRIRLDRWDRGSMEAWQPPGNANHPEVGQIDSGLYLGYGPLRSRTALKAGAAVQAGETATLRLALGPPVQNEEPERIATALALTNLYGTLGGRSRNGWGSLALEPLDGTRPVAFSPDADLLRPWRDALALDWPHAIGRDQRGALIWQTQAFPDWKAAMRRLAEIKIALRTQFTFARGERRPQDRHWLSYPVTHHAVDAWEKDRLRLPNSLRFKLRTDGHNSARLHGIIFHVPCMPPPKFNPGRRAIESVWQRVHELLDDPAHKLSRISA